MERSIIIKGNDMNYRTKLKLGLLSATVFTSAALAMPAMAQEPQAAAADDGDSIIVTGTRRSTTIMETPINIAAMGSEQLERQRVQDIRDIADFTPGLTISDTGPGSTGSIILRGLGASDVDSSGLNYDNTLGVYMGEVPLYYDFKLLDLDRVETLLGPQGTLYGLGTMAGAIRYIPNRPNVDDFEGEVHGSFYGKSHGSKPGYQADAVINIPIAKDYVAFRSATGYYYDPGFIDYTMLLQDPGVSLPQPVGSTDITDDFYAANLKSKKDLNFEKTFTTRNQLLFTAGPDFSAIFTYAYQKTKTEGSQTNSAGVFGTGKYQNASRYTEPTTRKANLISLEVNANVFDVADLVATTAYTKVKVDGQADNTDLLLDLDYGYEGFSAFSSWNERHTKREQYNQELRLVSKHGGPFSWVIGGFHNENKYASDYAEHVPNHPWVEFGTGPNPEELEYVSYTRSKVTEVAVFGEGSFKITPSWQITAGARYFDYSSEIAGAQTLPLLGQPLSPYDKDASGGKAGKSGWVWKFNTSYNFTPDLMAYATYSKGYRIGGPNTVAPCDDPLPPGQNICALPDELQYGPDTTKNIEVGIRTQLFNRKLTFNFDVYQIKWQGIQVASATVNGATGIRVNGGSAESKGFETSFQLRPVPQLTIQGTYSYTDAKLTEDVAGILTIRETPGDYSNRFVQLDALDGDRLPGSAKNSGSLGATYTLPVMDGSLIANWTATYRGNVVSRLGWERSYGDKIPSYVMHRASLTYEADKYSVSLFANNIFDKYAIVSVGNDRSRIGVNDGVTVRYYNYAVANPRTFGIEGRIKY